MKPINTNEDIRRWNELAAREFKELKQIKPEQTKKRKRRTNVVPTVAW